MSAISTGGPAFPGQFDHGHTVESWIGMTLRDYFAAKAMNGILSRPSGDDLPDDEVALQSYEMADAMLEARKPA